MKVHLYLRLGDVMTVKISNKVIPAYPALSPPAPIRVEIVMLAKIHPVATTLDVAT